MKYNPTDARFTVGFGTTNELFETLTLLQTKKISNFTAVLFGKDYVSKTIEQMIVMQEIGTI